MNAPSRKVVPLPVKADFDVPGVFMNGAFAHPVPWATAQAMQGYVASRAGLFVNTQEARDRAIQLFAQLAGADVDELAWVPSTTAAENMVVNALGLRSAGSVVTDALHFEGSLYLYQELAAQGRSVTIVPQQDGEIPLEALEKAIAPGATLVAVSFVSAFNGFEHDLRKVCEIAHAKGALVYADLIQGAGATPIDLHDTGVDFAACASYKWLMGDFGAGFLYVRRDRQKALQALQQSYRQLQSYATHQFPFDAPGSQALSYRKRTGAGALFELGTLGNSAAVALSHSLAYLLDIGIDRIEAHRQPLLAALQQELPRHGFIPLTPRRSRSALVAFAYEGAGPRFAQPLQDAGLHVQLYANRIRISPTILNDMPDVERLLAVLGQP